MKAMANATPTSATLHAPRSEKILTKDSAVSALDEIVRLARVQRVAVFCFEASEHHCHREQVLEAARARLEPAFA